MANFDFTGAWRPNASNNQRMRLRTTVVVPTPAPGASSVTVTGTVWVDAGWSFNDNNNTFSHSGSLLGSGSMTRSINVATNGSQAIYTFSKAVTLTSAAQGHTVAFSLTGIEYVPGTASVSGTVTIPAAVPPSSQLAPNAPTGVGVTRKSDTHHVIAYTGTGTSERPIGGVKIIRELMGSGGATNLVANLAWGTPIGTTSGGVNDKATGAGQGYRWGVQLYNETGSSAWVYTGWIKTSPAGTPSSLKLSRSGSNVTASWGRTAAQTAHWDAQRIRFQYGGASADWSAWTALSAAATSHTFTPSEPVVRVQVAGRTTTGATLDGPPATSGWLVALTAPNRPTPTGPTVPQLVGSSTMTWTHNPVDGTAQTQYQHRYRIDGGSWVESGTITSGTSSRTVALTAGVIGWQVRTRGAHADFSDWSTEAQFVVAERPTVSITDPPPGSLDSNRIAATINYGDASGASMTSWRRQLTRDAVVIESAAGTGAPSVITFNTPLEDGATYTASIWATSGNGLESLAATRTWTADFSLPQRPMLLDASWVESEGHVRLAAALAEDAQLLPDPEGLDADLLEERAAASSGGVSADHVAGGLVAALVAVDDNTATFRWGAPGPVEVFPGITYKVTGDMDSAAANTSRRWQVEVINADGTEALYTGPQVGHGAPVSGPVTPWEWTATEHGFAVPSLAVTVTLGSGDVTVTNVQMAVEAAGVTPDHVRIERSLTEGADWQALADDLPVHGGHTDHQVPLNPTPTAWYRVVSVSALGVERPGVPVIVGTPGQVAWINSGDERVAITYDLELERQMGHGVVLEDYLSEDVEQYPTAHYSPRRTDVVRMMGRIQGDVSEAQLQRMLGRTVWWRDPRGRSWPATITADGATVAHANRLVGSVALAVERVANDPD